ncbi:TrkH family potassium uptake protein [Anaerotruncus rubiinfantis]|uniref:TrkH family potassium uptake protein n=1 Tax=Anaerotruncus rubiinfantis TaxID=1720200 RepID=UPI003D7A0BC5
MSKILGGLTPAKVILGGFLLLILSGTLLLMLPFATRSGESVPFLDALFTATSATCVTGLVLHDTYTFWSEFGQLVILLLIQTGGMGVVTVAVAVAMFTGKKIGLRQRLVMQESISAPQMGGIVRLTSFILKATFLFEGIGAFFLALRFCPEFGLLRGLWFAVFHSISAFCNAGFDLMGIREPFSSLTRYVSDPLVNLPVMLLIVTGGIGFFVWDDLRHNKLNIHHYRLQTKLVLSGTGLLILLPAAFFFFYEFQQPGWSGMSIGERLLASLFQSVTPRTAGFNTVDLTQLQSPGILLIISLMVIGGSPGSTAGGIKTTTFAMLILCVGSTFRKKDCIQCFSRRIPPEALRNAVTILMLYLTLFLCGGNLISCVEGLPLSAALFEAASAIGTVGLSLGITGELGVVSRITLITLMYFGRVGGLTMLYALADGHLRPPAQLPLEKVTVG